MLSSGKGFTASEFFGFALIFLYDCQMWVTLKINAAASLENVSIFSTFCMFNICQKPIIICHGVGLSVSHEFIEFFFHSEFSSFGSLI